MRLHFDPISNSFIPFSGEMKESRERKVLMHGHDLLPPEWRALSCLIQGRAVENHWKRGTPIEKVKRAVVGVHRGRLEG